MLFLTQDFPPNLGGIGRLYEQLCAHLPPGSVEVCTVALPRGAARRTPGVAGGGAAGYATDSPGAAPAAGVGASASLPGDGAAFAYAPPAGLRVHRMPFPYRRAKVITSVLRWTAWTGRRLRAGGVRLIHAGEIRPAGYIAAWMRARRGVPYLLYVHGHDVFKEAERARASHRRRATARWILGGAAAIVANSRATAVRTEALLELLGVPPAGRVHVVHPGTDPDRFRPDAPGAASWRERLGMPAGTPVLLTVARLIPRKGVDTVLRALPALPGTHYVVAGNGPDRPRLEALAAELGVRERVTFVGAVDDAALPGLYAAADLFVMTPREEPGRQDVEGFGIVYCEAAAAGLPVVAARSGGVAEAVREGETALLVPPDDRAALAAALRALVDDAALRRRMGNAGRKAVETYYNWERAAAELQRVIAGIVDPRTGNPDRDVPGVDRDTRAADRTARVADRDARTADPAPGSPHGDPIDPHRSTPGPFPGTPGPAPGTAS